MMVFINKCGVLRIIFIIYGILLSSFTSNAQCQKSELTLSSQKQINDFGDTFSHCPSIEADVTIGVPYGETDINDLSPLAHINHIEGHLNILNNSELKTLKGLDSLTTIGGYLNIYNNNGLKDLNGLRNISKAGGSLWVVKNDSLVSITGLQNIESINGSLDIKDNPFLKSLHGLERIDLRSVIPTLDFQLVQMIDVRITGNHAAATDQSSILPYILSNKDLIGRFQNMLDKPYSQRAVETDLLYRHIETILDSAQAHSVMDKIAEIAHDSGIVEMKWEAELLKSYWQLKNGTAPLAQRIASMHTLVRTAHDKGLSQIEARALKFISYKYLMKLEEYEKIFYNYHALEQVLDNLSPEDFPDMAQCYMLIGRAHYMFKDYKEAIRYFGKAAAIPQIPFNTTFIMHSLNNLGLCYQNLNRLDSSDFYFNQILADTTSYPVEIWGGIASGNLGHNHYRRGEYDQAIPLLQRDIDNALAMDDAGLAAGSLIPLADIRLKQNAMVEAKSLIDRARECIYKSGQTARLRHFFPVLIKWYAAMGQKDRVADYIDSTEQVIRGYNDEINELKLLRIHQESNAKLRIYQMERTQLKQQRNFVIVISILLFILASIFLWNRNKSIKRKHELHQLELNHAQESLENARSRLAYQAKKIRENDKVIHQIQHDLKGDTVPLAIQELKNATILTKEDWILFKKNFQKAYPGLMSTLKTSYPGLTPAEIRSLCLLKLGLTNREMASAQGVSLQSIYVTNHRIRKKLQIDSQKKMEELVRGLK